MNKVRALRGSRVTTQSNKGRKTEFDYPRGSLCPFFYLVKTAICFKGFVLSQGLAPTGSQEEPTKTPTKEKNPAAVALGHLGGLKGGKARAQKMSAKRRKEIAQKAAKARWGNK